jgi:cell division cycle protein 37
MARNFKIAQLEADVDCNTLLLGRVIEIEKEVREKGPAHYSQLVDRLRSAPSDEKPPQSGPDSPTYDAMILTLLTQVWEKCKEEGVGRDDSDLGEKLAERIGEHVAGLKEDIAKKSKELEEEAKERNKKITSEDIHEGWDSKVKVIW